MEKLRLLFFSFLITVKLFAQPVITSFTPASGPIGTTVTITGTQFDPIASQNVVYFGAVKAAVSLATGTSLIVTVPAGATYQPITVTTNNLTAYSNKPFIVTFNGATGPFTSNLFLPKTDINYPVGTNPYAVAAGDFDGDGKADLLVPLGGSDTVSVFRNISPANNISFSSPFNFHTTGRDNEECTIGDLDGDGRLDFVITNGTDAPSFSVFRNTSTIGNISFASKVDYPTGGTCFFVAIHDLSGDGKPDIAVANYRFNTVSVYLNTSTPGNISFNTKLDFTTNATPYFIAADDLDGDGKPDLVVLTQASVSTLSVLKNTTAGGTPSFAPNSNIGSLNPSYFASISDFDGDSKPDIAATNGNTVAIFKNSSIPGTISFNTPQNFPIGNTAVCTAVSDLNGDGKPDLAVSNQSLGTVSALRNISSVGNIAFDTHIQYAADINPFSITAADFDGDQRPDIVSANSNVHSISILKNAISIGAPPSVTSFTPTSGITGSEIKIFGTNFTSVTSVSFGGVPAQSFTVDSTTGITAVVGNGATGNVIVTAAFGTATLPGFTYNGPAITSFAPTSGVTGTSVIIKGLNFTGATAVKFGGAPASSFTIDSSTGITAIVGSGFSGSVAVTTTNGTGSLNGFTYNLPTITSFTPISGPIGTTVTISGAHFDPIAAGNLVYFGSVKATVSAATDSTLIVTVPLGASYHPITVTANNITGYSDKPFVVTFPGGGSISLTSFIPKVDLITGNYPHSLASADFDGDGKIDLLVSKGSSNTVTILKNTSSAGTISFAPKLDLPATGNDHEGCAIGDLDGDGKLDLAIVNSIPSNTVSVYRNTSTSGNISFAARIDYPVINAPYAVTIGDLNGDGRPELIVANNGSDTISIYRNVSKVGNISFDSKLDIFSGTNPYSVSVGDLDGDGKPDLVLTTQGSSSSLSAMRNTSTAGNISFASKTNLATLATPFIISIGDLDLDGRPDLVAASASSNKIVVLKNLSSPGIISFASKLDFAVGNYPVCVSLGDLDGDGRPDIMTSNRFSNDISVLRNKTLGGNMSFDSHVDYPVGADPIYVIAGDIDGDSRPDIISANSAADGISILRNVVGVNFAPSISSFTPAAGINGTAVTIIGSNLTGTTAASFGGIPATSFTVDSATGITAVVGPGASGDVSVTTGYGTATLAGFTFNGPIITSFTPTVGPSGTLVTIKGVNFTGATSVKFGGTAASAFTVDSATGITATVGAGSSGSVTVSTPNGTASLAGFIFGLPPTIASFTPASGPIGTIVVITGANFDAIPSNNIVFFGAVRATVSSATPTTLIVTVPGGATYQPITVTVNTLTTFSSLPFIVTFEKDSIGLSTRSFSLVQNLTVGAYPFEIAMGDFNNDGKPDIVTSNANSSTISILKNTSGSTISFAPKIDYAAAPGPGKISVSDINGDGKLDIVVANLNSGYEGTVSIFRNNSTNGNIAFESKIDYVTGNGPTGVDVADMNGDGKPDIVVASGNSAILSVLRNTTVQGGSISFAPKQDYPLFYAYAVTVADLDKDGKFDIIATDFGGAGISIYRNTSSAEVLSFADKIGYNVGTHPNFVTTGDLDGDGKLDLAVTNYSGSNISFYKNNSTSGIISMSAAPDYIVGAYPVNLSVGDLDGDGKLDLAAGRQLAGLVAVIGNEGTGNFSFADTLNFATGNYDTHVSVGDLNGDGKPELAVVNRLQNTVSILRNKIGEPQIAVVSSTVGGDGTNINIVGNNFSEATAVEFGGIAARSFTVRSATQIDAMVGGGASGDISVTTPRGTGTFGGFTFIPAISAAGPTTFCGGGSLTLTSSAVANNQWFKDNIAINGATARTLSVTSSGTYKVKTTSNGITTSSDSIVVNAIIVPAPVITRDANNNLISSAATGNQWYFNGNLIPGATNQTYHPLENGSYTVRDTLNNCLSEFSVAYNFTITGIVDLGNNQYIKLYPNPVKNKLNLNWYIAGRPALNIELINSYGRLLLVRRSVRDNVEIDISRLPANAYFLKVYDEQFKINYTFKIIKE